MEQVVLFEDPQVSDLSPITDLIPMQEVVMGGGKQFFRFDSALGTKTRWLVRKELEKRVPPERKPDFGEKAILINARLISIEVVRLIKKLDLGEALTIGSELVMAKVKSLDFDLAQRTVEGEMKGLKEKPCKAKLAKHIWDVSPSSVTSHLSKDLSTLFKLDRKPVRGDIKIVGRFPVNIAEDIDVLGPITIDVREGPVVIEEGVQIEPYAYLKGPLRVGAYSVIVTGSRVAGSFIGVHGRIGGEVTTSVISDYSNKYHLGFLGHSYVGRWVNIGAGSITSNLKNTYGEIKVGGKPTGLNKVGAFIGDHAKLSIGTLTYAGVRVGVASHLHGLVYEDVPPFTIYAKSLGWGLYELDLESAIRTYRRMAPRRGVDPDPVEEDLLRLHFQRTDPQRREKGVLKERLRIK
ncbi:MAG TPA: hypothetical protein ENF57_01235 [Candidatus Korarchaeota archaeon]|nr:hypothetical protein [Candidatus Korarchaeota archaeon]